MTIKKILIALTALGACAMGVVSNEAGAATKTTCAADFISVNDTQVCSNNNLNFTAFATKFPNPAATRLANRLFRISATGAGIITDGYNANQARMNTCSTGVNRDTSGTKREDQSGCGGMAFHRTFPVL
jgi:hypothetical protein